MVGLRRGDTFFLVDGEQIPILSCWIAKKQKKTNRLDEKVFMDSEHMRERTDPTREQLLEPVLCCQYLRY